MTGKTHLTFGIGTGVLFATLTEPKSAVLGIGMVGLSMLGSLAPDIDSRTSKISKKMKITSMVASKMFGHRGFLHSPICAALIYIIGILLLKNFDASEFSRLLSAFIIGYIGHLFLDMLTKAGIPLLYPFSQKKVHLTNFKTGGKAEKALFVSACIFTVAIVTIYLVYGKQIASSVQHAVAHYINL